MTVEYRNRKGETYRLYVGKTATGKPKYYMTKNPKAKGEPAECMPEGYEIHESPEDGRVVARKIRPSRITPQEKSFLEACIRERTAVRHYVVEADGDALVIYLTNYDESSARRMEEVFGPRVHDFMSEQSQFSKMMRFALESETPRRFTVQRWCFRGMIDDWIFLDGPAELAALAERYVPHLGRESFFDLI